MARRFATSWVLPVACCLLPVAYVGCANHQEQTRKALMRELAPTQDALVAQPYRVGCPDVLRFRCARCPEIASVLTIEANGCVPLAGRGGVRVEGLTLVEAQRELAEVLGVEFDAVHIEVVEYRQQQVYVFGEVDGSQRAIPFRGPETVAELLHRAGGLTKDGAPTKVRVVRNPTSADTEPKVYAIDLQAILLKGDNRTNLVVQPNDQIYVPESKQARFGKCLHPWLQKCWEYLGGR